MVVPTVVPEVVRQENVVLWYQVSKGVVQRSFLKVEQLATVSDGGGDNDEADERQRRRRRSIGGDNDDRSAIIDGRRRRRRTTTTALPQVKLWAAAGLPVTPTVFKERALHFMK